MTKRLDRVEQREAGNLPAIPASPDPNDSPRSPIAPFVLGTVIGGIAGTIVG
ncbi:MAG: hypothetical protein K0S99_3201, partial [Thermomicrobiales bacterium]|nr:hypothetical protein [Thermomicrobiales bacterium]